MRTLLLLARNQRRMLPGVSSGRGPLRSMKSAGRLPAGREGMLPDTLGVIASVGCAIHCAAMPLVITFLPVLGLGFLADASFHKFMVGICALMALLAFWPGWRVHRRWLPAGIATFGLTTIAVAAFTLEDTCACCPSQATSQRGPSANILTDTHPALSVCTLEHCKHCASRQTDESREVTPSPVLAGFVSFITPLGGILLVIAHLMNRHFASLCGCCPPKTAEA